MLVKFPLFVLVPQNSKKNSKTTETACAILLIQSLGKKET